LPGSAETLKVPFDFLLSWQHSCQKLSKSVDVGRRYIKPK